MTTATDQATASATEAASEAAEEAASQAATQAATEASNQAAAESAGEAADRASVSVTDQTAAGVSGDAGETASRARDDAVSRHGAGREASEGLGENNRGERETGVSESHEAVQSAEAASRALIDVLRDFDGSEIRAHEIVVLLSKADEAAVQNLDLKIVTHTPLDSLGAQLLRIRIPDGTKAADALQAIQTAAPDAFAAENHVFRTARGHSRHRRARHFVRPRMRPAVAESFEGLVGVIDTAVDPSYPGLKPALVDSRSFADGAPADTVHGTAVAELIAQRHVQVIAANVFASDEHGAGAATTDSILRALNWLVSRKVTVINMSIEGPLDGALSEAIRRAQAKGCIIVAAAGNRGPAAPPAYPGAFPAVVAVTAIDKHDRIYPYANQGQYISFSALGVDVETAQPPVGRRVASGTSFAAPVVAALIARLNRSQTPESAHAVLTRLEKRARHLGPPGRNPVFGYGAVDNEILAER